MDISINIYDVNGIFVNRIINGTKNPGRRSVVWNGINFNGKKVSSGIYFYELRSSENIIAKKMILLK